eukprot:CAMPEP_0116569218 /NCGR_PEP_ID=MMETSP0397-20121206/16171_1 /TAXON_ID=216820 /ORGANISM="Cyclophora tenuis, Strain ECT3854" /LENGTH=171 /DNA_ID=CAMNT_0004096757 /DNA_START=57 /DNA_END=572 /DNA_ORIENTATION=+
MIVPSNKVQLYLKMTATPLPPPLVSVCTSQEKDMYLSDLEDVDLTSECCDNGELGRESQHHIAETSRRVQFASTLVSHVWERPRTLPDEKAELFYSGEDYQRFRIAFRELRRQRILAARRQAQPFSFMSSLSGIAKKASVFASSFVKRDLTFSEDQRGPDTVVLVDTLYLF